MASDAQHRNLLMVVLATLLAASISCDPQPEETHPASVVADSAGVTIVDNYSAAWSEETAWRRSNSPVLTIGAVEGSDSTVLFASIESLARLSDGRIVVVESQTSEIRWFDRGGRHLATRGGRGGGPGKFNFAAQLLQLPGDTILVEDRPAIDHVYFGPTMVFIREERLDRSRFDELGPWADCVGSSLPDGSFIACRPEGEALAEFRAGRFRSYSKLVRVTWALDSVYDLGTLGGIEQWRIEVTGQSCKQRIPTPVCLRSTLHPFYSSGHYSIGAAPPRVVIAVNPEYVVEIWTLDGQLNRVVRRHGARREPTQEERVEADSEISKWAPGDEVLLNRFRHEMATPDSIPAVYDLTVGIRGDIWILREGILQAQPNALYDIFDADGRFLGEMRFPRRFRVQEVGTDYVLGIRTDANDVPFVELYALDRREGV